MARTRLPLAALVAALLAAAAPAAEVDRYLVPSLVRLRPVGAMEPLIEEALQAGWDVVARSGGAIEVMLPRREARALLRLQRIRRVFDAREGGERRPLRAGSALAAVEVLHMNADDALAPFAGRADAGAYHTYEEVLAEIDAHVAAHPDRIRREVLGTTHEGRDIVAVEITGPGSKEGRPATLITGLHHAREWISVEVPVGVIDMLVTGYGEDPWVTEILDTRRVWVVPVVNPDGLHYSQTKRRMWRKNRKPAGWGARGVDPNRNYGHEWGGTGASGIPYSDTYRGPEAFSEEETRAIRDLALREGFVSSLSFHSYSQLVLWPWGYTYDPSPAEEELARHGKKMGEITGYRPMKSSGLYRTSGDFGDWFYGATGALTYTFELGRQFVPPERDIPEIVARNLRAVRYFLEHTVAPTR